MKLRASHASRPKVGETQNGDGVVVRDPGEKSLGLVAVVDALGHGPDAAQVTEKARRYLDAVSLDFDVRRIVEGLHTELRSTRGAAAMVCVFRGGKIEGCGVGNVDLRVQGATVPVVLTPGVLGGSVRSLRVFEGAVSVGSRLALFSDGISSRFSLDGVRKLSPSEASSAILAQHSYQHDDATVLIADVEL